MSTFESGPNPSSNPDEPKLPPIPGAFPEFLREHASKLDCPDAKELWSCMSWLAQKIYLSNPENPQPFAIDYSDTVSIIRAQKYLLVTELSEPAPTAATLQKIWGAQLALATRFVLMAPEHPHGWSRVGEYLSKLGEHQLALTARRRWVELESDNEGAHRALADSLEALGFNLEGEVERQKAMSIEILPYLRLLIEFKRERDSE